MNERIKHLMSELGISEQEAKEVLAYDERVDKNEKTEYDLTEEQQKVAKSYTKVESKTVTTSPKREKKENATKIELIKLINDFLVNSNFSSVSITNVERQITFSNGENDFELTLVQKRPPKEKK